MRDLGEYRKVLDAYDEVSGEIYRILYEYCPSHIVDYDGLLSWEWNKENQCIEIAYLDGRYYHKGRSIPLENVLEWSCERGIVR